MSSNTQAVKLVYRYSAQRRIKRVDHWGEGCANTVMGRGILHERNAKSRSE